VSGDAEELRALVALPSEPSEPRSTTTDDRRRDGNGLDVRDGGGATEESDVGGEGGLQPGLALLALDRLDERRLLSADVSTGSTVKVDVEVVAGTAGVLADETGLVRLLDRLLDVVRLLEELSTDVDVG
jgi:hypothetical protein